MNLLPYYFGASVILAYVLLAGWVSYPLAMLGLTLQMACAEEFISLDLAGSRW